MSLSARQCPSCCVNLSRVEVCMEPTPTCPWHCDRQLFFLLLFQAFCCACERTCRKIRSFVTQDASHHPLQNSNFVSLNNSTTISHQNHPARCRFATFQEHFKFGIFQEKSSIFRSQGGGLIPTKFSHKKRFQSCPMGTSSQNGIFHIIFPNC